MKVCQRETRRNSSETEGVDPCPDVVLHGSLVRSYSNQVRFQILQSPIVRLKDLDLLAPGMFAEILSAGVAAHVQNIFA